MGIIVEIVIVGLFLLAALGILNAFGAFKPRKKAHKPDPKCPLR